VSRATTLIVNLGGGTVPGLTTPPDDIARAWPDLGPAFERALAEAERAMADFAFHRALAAIWEFIGAVNRYVDTTQPWALPKQPDARPRLEHALSMLAESLRLLGIVLAPFLPESAAKIRAAVGQTADPKLSDARWGGLRAGTPVTRLSGLFPRVDETKAPAAPAATPAGAASPRISIDDFGKVELRIAEVTACEAVPKSKKLLKLTVNLGGEQRTVVSGIAAHYAPADLVGKKIVLVANLEPAKLMGIESNGMVLSGEIDGRLAVLTLDRDLPPGAKVK
jgi:methionyl-tRNA synthetase